MASGLVAGLVAITPAAGYVGPMAAVAIGLVAGGVCFGGVMLKARFHYDDALDAFGVHGVGGALGAVLTGVFASKLYNPDGGDGLVHGQVKLLGEQVIAIAAAGAWAAVMSFAILKLVDRLVGLRAAKDYEQEGLDSALHGEEAYTLADAGSRAARDLAEEEEPEPAISVARADV